MASINEHISGTVELYDHTTHAWSTICMLSDSNVISASTQRQCCTDGTFEIGGVYTATLSLTCRLPGMSRFQIKGAKITIQTWYGSDQSQAEPMGTFWVTDAQKIGEIFTISRQCGIGWADTSSYNELSDAAAQDMAHLISPNGATGELQYLMGYGGGYIYGITRLANTFAEAQTGVSDMICWEDYDTTLNGDYCNQWIYAQPSTKTGYTAGFSVYGGSGVSATDCPRDYYRWLAQLAGGFITSKRNGALTLRQFGMPEFGTAEIHMADAEQDSFEVADYTLQLYRVSVTPEVEGAVGMSIWTNPDYAHRVPIRYTIESNPVLDGFCKRWIVDEGSVPSVWTIAHNLWWSFYYHYGDLQIRPFRVKTHKPGRYELGQNIMLYFKDLHETEETAYQSIITSVQWTFRGGYTLSCGGEDSRVMADCIRTTKADKALKEARNRAAALRNRGEE